MFSLQSRQFDKAIERFKTVIDQKPDAESYFYLATGYENIGMKKEAVTAFQKVKSWQLIRPYHNSSTARSGN
ncbi:hypothetical protein KUH03_19585 [Sphingobacterium sp. E70]|uniref:tetratricopeptide repeat protein n=1 Tax=Sphingobacterium sp. E70 TaxID=2853439 RepID=UPI00211C0FD7|nr:tetratricopeptide repeat protein [Sphingobacterium sp. E70]ULT28534.1 hypothetical protein KUH03_19585 [Sphingobacterium sp. E70]